MNPELFEAFADCSPFYRDTTLSESVLAKYRVGLLLREPTFCDASYKFGGFAAPHRYLIISANARCVDDLAENPNRGHCLWMTGSIFKVIGLCSEGRNIQITLLEIPEELKTQFITPSLSEMEQVFADLALKQFQDALHIPPDRELASAGWLDRLTYPVGVSDDGGYFECWEYGAKPAEI